MKKNMLKKGGRRLLAAALAAVTAFGLAACGGEEQSGDNTPLKEWVYVPTYLTIDDDNVSYYDMKQVGDNLYYISYNYDEEAQRSVQELCKYSLADNSLTKRPLEWETKEGQDWNIHNFSVTTEGDFLATAYLYEVDKDGNYSDTQFFCKLDPEGKEVFRIDLTKHLEEDPENSYISGMLQDKEGHIYLYGGSKVWLFAADGAYQGSVSTGNGMGGWINAAGCGKDGLVYISGYGIGSSEGTSIASVDFAGKKLGQVYENFPDSNSQTIVSGVAQDFLVSDSDALYEYDVETQTRTEVLQWLECDINGSYVQGYGTLPDGRYFAVVNDWDTHDNGIAVLTKTKASEVVQKESILMGSLYSDNELKAAVIKFNKSNDKYRINVKNYIDYSTNSETAYEDGYTRFLNDLTSKNGPDIIDLNGINIRQLAAKGVFEDLNPYLEKSTRVKKDDFVASVVKGYELDGKQISIPANFELTTIVGATEKLGDAKSWTLKEMIAFADKYPEAELFDNMTKESLLYTMLRFNEEMFIDWSTGKCAFNEEEFKSLLQFVNRFPDDYNYSEDAPSTPTRIQNGEVLLDTASIYNWESIQIYWEMFGGDVTCIGFPAEEGKSGTAMMGSKAYAIAAKSDKKEGAWAFLEEFLSQEESDFWFGFPSNKAQLQTMMEEAMKVEYVLDENGNKVLDENGEPLTYGGGDGIGYQDGWEYTYTIPTQKEADIILSLMEDATPISYGMESWMEMINEEAAAFFAGQKSVDEVANIIQGRVQIYVDENR